MPSQIQRFISSFAVRALVLTFFGLASAMPARALPPGSTPREIELGEGAAEDIGRAVRFVDDEETLAKLQAMLDEIAAATDRPQIRYTPHIVATPAVNAFVIPGGWVYVTTGLLASVESDDELAGVLAHEIAHNVNQHALKRMHDAPKGMGLLQLAAIAAMIIGRSPEIGLLASAAANTITALVLQGGSIAAEVEADREGIYYLTQTQFNPTGALTFHERMAGTAGRLFEEDMGIYRTHPFSRDRVIAARTQLDDLGVPIHRRKVTRAPQPVSRAFEEDGRPRTEVVYEGTRLLVLDGDDEERATSLEATIRWALDHEMQRADIKIVPKTDGVIFEPGKGPPFFFSPADGAVDGEGEAVLATKLRDRLVELVLDEQTRIQANTALY